MVEFKIRDHPGDPGIGAVRGLAVFGPVQFRIEPVRGHGPDGVFLFQYVLPQGINIRGIGENTPHADHRNLVADLPFRTGKDLQGIQGCGKHRLVSKKAAMHVGDARRLPIKDQAATHHEIAAVVLFGFIELTQANRAALLDFRKVRAAPLGPDEKGPEIIPLKGLLALGRGSCLPNGRQLSGHHPLGKRGAHGPRGQPHAPAHHHRCPGLTDDLLVAFLQRPGGDNLFGEQIGSAHLDAHPCPATGQHRGHARNKTRCPARADTAGEDGGFVPDGGIVQTEQPLHGQLPENQTRKAAHMATGFGAFKNKAAAPAGDGIVQHGRRRRVQVGLDALIFQCPDLGRLTGRKQGKGNPVLSYQIQVPAKALVQRLNTDETRTEPGNHRGAVGQHAIGQVHRQAGHGQKRQCPGVQHGQGKFSRVTDVGHGPLNNGIGSPVNPGQGAVGDHGIVIFHQGQPGSDGGKKAMDHLGQPIRRLDEMFGKDGILAQEKQALDRFGHRMVQCGEFFVDMTVQNRVGIRLARDPAFRFLQCPNHPGAELGKDPVGAVKGLTHHPGVAVFHTGQKGFEFFGQGGFGGKVELVVHDEAAGPGSKNTGRRMPAHPAVDKNRKISLFQVMLHEHESAVPGDHAPGLMAADNQTMGGKAMEGFGRVHIHRFNEQLAVPGRDPDLVQFVYMAIAQDQQVEMGRAVCRQ